MDLLRTGCLWIGLLCGCSPALDWRQVRPTDFGLEALFPCRPAGLSRTVVLAQRRIEMVMHACAAGGSTFAIGALTLDDVRDVDAALAALGDAAANNLGSVTTALQAVQVPGMTPHAQAGRRTVTGRRPDGSAVVEHLVVFSRGIRVYQAMVVGNQPDPEAVAAFFASLKLVA